MKDLDYKTHYDNSYIKYVLDDDQIRFIVYPKILTYYFSKNDKDGVDFWLEINGRDVDSQSYDLVLETVDDLTDEILFSTIPNLVKLHLNNLKNSIDEAMEIL